MTPKEEAKELLEKMSYNNFDEHHNCSHYVAKNCALIAVDEIISSHYKILSWVSSSFYDYWVEVKQEIERL
jgi:putative IMPACT (imprinted ancient) family translation regulator